MRRLAEASQNEVPDSSKKPKSSERRDMRIPLLSLSSCEALLEWSWHVGVLLVESGDRFDFVGFFRWLPARVIKSHPLKKVLQSLSIHPRVENGVHIPFLPAIGSHQGWRSVLLP